jgi:hypothetical protein
MHRLQDEPEEQKLRRVSMTLAAFVLPPNFKESSDG